MKKLLLAILMPVTLLMTGPGSVALAGEMTPSSIALDLMDVSSLDQKAAKKQELKADVPTVDDGNNQPGVDIVNESLNYHNKVNPQQATQRPVLSNPAQTGMLNGQIRQNSYGPAAYNQNGMMMNGYQQNMPMSNMPMQYPTQMPGMAQPMMPNPYQAYAMQQQQQRMNNENMKKAIGVVGAAALMGVFIKNGGLGGVTRSMGWDNKRHIRGSSIGGY